MSMLLPVLVMPLGLAAAAALAGFLYAVELRDAAELCAAELDAGSGARPERAR